MDADNATTDGIIPDSALETSNTLNGDEIDEDQPQSTETATSTNKRPQRPPPTYKVSPQMQKQIDEQQARVAKNDAAEASVQQEWFQQANHAMREWYTMQEHNLEKTKRKNRETSRNRAQKEEEAKAALVSNTLNPWERIANLCDITSADPTTAPAVDVHRQQVLLPLVKTDLSRMREVMRTMCRAPMLPEKLKAT